MIVSRARRASTEATTGAGRPRRIAISRLPKHVPCRPQSWERNKGIVSTHRELDFNATGEGYEQAEHLFKIASQALANIKYILNVNIYRSIIIAPTIYECKSKGTAIIHKKLCKFKRNSTSDTSKFMLHEIC